MTELMGAALVPNPEETPLPILETESETVSQDPIPEELTETQNRMVDVVINDGRNFTVKLLDPSEKSDIDAALKLETEIWERKNYGDLGEYAKYLPQSRVFASFDDTNECIGVTRLFAGTPETPPFMSLPIEDDSLRTSLEHECTEGMLEELGTAAVHEKAPAVKIALDMWRLAYRDARSRGIKHWGIIMEPNRVEVMNKRYGFTFRKIGLAIDYQGGMCAAHLMDLDEVDQHMSQQKPDYYQWFVNEPLNPTSKLAVQ